MVERYAVVSWPSDTLRIEGGTYIYILCYAYGGRDVPFYVGQTVDLKSRFATHKRIGWHHQTFAKPVHIYVAGQVAASHADVAEQELISHMIDSSFIMTNSDINSYEAKRLNLSRLRLESAPAGEVLAYFTADTTPKFQVDSLQDWSMEWHTKPVPGDLIDTGLLREHLAGMGEDLTEDEREIHELLTRVYDFRTACAAFRLSDREAALEGLRRIWSIPREGAARDLDQCKTRLHPAAIEVVRQNAEVFDPQWMNAWKGVREVNLAWAPRQRFAPYLIAKREADRLLRKLQALEDGGGDTAEVQAFQLELQPRLDALEALKYRLDAKYM